MASDLDLLNRLTVERNDAVERARALEERADTAEKKLSAIETDRGQARKATEQRDEAIRARRKLERELEVARREGDGLRTAFEKTLDEVESYKDMLVEAKLAHDALKDEIRDLKDGARIVEQGLEGELRRAKARVRELEPLEERLTRAAAGLRELLG